MQNSTSGVIAVSWSQTELDGLEAAPVEAMAVGSAWSWRGRSVQLRGASVAEQADAWSSKGMTVNAACGPVVGIGRVSARFTVTNGARRYRLLVLETGNPDDPLVLFDGEAPPRDQELWISEISRFSPEAVDTTWVQTGVVTPLHGTRSLAG